MIYIGNDKFEVGAVLPVEIGGFTIGDAEVSEITDTHVEVLYRGEEYNLPLDVEEYFETRRDLSGLGL